MEAKFAVGDRVDQSPRDWFVGTVKAVHTTSEGETIFGELRRPRSTQRSLGRRRSRTEARQG
jgi:hypothetical protein